MNKNLPKTLSRLAAVQTCFQSFYNEKSINVTANEFNEYRFNTLLDINNIKLEYDKKYFNDIINNVENFKSNYNFQDFFSKFLLQKRPYERLDLITKAILIVASSEIINNKNISINIIINDYIEISKSFLEKPEVSMINAILDNINESINKKK